MGQGFQLVRQFRGGCDQMNRAQQVQHLQASPAHGSFCQRGLHSSSAPGQATGPAAVTLWMPTPLGCPES